MTAVMPEQDIETFVFEDAEFEIVCDISSLKLQDWGFPNCPGDPATWIAWRPGCCTNSVRYRLICDSCKAVYQKWQARQAAIHCGACGQETGGFVDFTPLRKGS